MISYYLLNMSEEVNSSQNIFESFVVGPFIFILEHCSAILNDNLGLGILAGSILIKVIFLPHMIAQEKNSEIIENIRPKVNDLKEAYDGYDLNEASILQQETRKLYKENGVSNFAGCLPVLIQMPLLIGFYFAIKHLSEVSNQTFLGIIISNTNFYLAFFTAITTFIVQYISIRKNSFENCPNICIISCYLFTRNEDDFWNIILLDYWKYFFVIC